MQTESCVDSLNAGRDGFYKRFDARNPIGLSLFEQAVEIDRGLSSIGCAMAKKTGSEPTGILVGSSFVDRCESRDGEHAEFLDGIASVGRGQSHASQSDDGHGADDASHDGQQSCRHRRNAMHRPLRCPLCRRANGTRRRCRPRLGYHQATTAHEPDQGAAKDRIGLGSG